MRLQLAITVFAVATAASCADGGAREAATSDTVAAATRSAADTQQARFAVRGMYCESCEQTIGAMLRRTPGVMSAQVSVEKGQADVVYDARATTPQKIAAVIETLGYKAALKSGS